MKQARERCITILSPAGGYYEAVPASMLPRFKKFGWTEAPANYKRYTKR